MAELTAQEQRFLDALRVMVREEIAQALKNKPTK